MSLHSLDAIEIRNEVWINAFSAENRTEYMNFINKVADAEIMANGLNNAENRYLEHAYVEFDKLVKLKDFQADSSVKDFLKRKDSILLISALSKITNNINKKFLTQLSESYNAINIGARCHLL